MNPRFRGRIGEYLWEKEQERLKRYKDRPWELRSKEPRDNPLIQLPHWPGSHCWPTPPL